MPPTRRTWVGVGVAVVVVVVAFGVLALVADRADEDEGGDRTRSANTTEVPGIIPEPRAGPGPEQSGDRGGWAQLLVLVVMVGALGLIGLLAFRSRGGRRQPPPG